MFALAIVRSTADLPAFRQQLARLHEARARAGANDPPLVAIGVYGRPVPADVADWFDDAVPGTVIETVGRSGVWSVFLIAGEPPRRGRLVAELTRRSASESIHAPIEPPSVVVVGDESEVRPRSASVPRSTRSSWAVDLDGSMDRSRRGSDPIVAGDRS